MITTAKMDEDSRKLRKVIGAAKRCCNTPMTNVPTSAPICGALLALAFALTDAGLMNPVAWPVDDERKGRK